jgi:hypothetical protein
MQNIHNSEDIRKVLVGRILQLKGRENNISTRKFTMESVSEQKAG